MIHAIRYDETSLTRKEDARLQKELSARLLKKAVLKERGIDIGGLKLSYGSHGKPYFADTDIYYNISHCKGLVLCAVNSAEVGIDAESMRPHSDRLLKRVCTESEIAAIKSAENPELQFIKFWTLKESYVKYNGIGLAFGAKNAEFVYEGEKIYNTSDRECNIFQVVNEIGGKLYSITVCSENEFIPELKLYKEFEI